MPRLLDRRLIRVFAASFCGVASFFLLLPVMPRYATEGGADEAGAGLVTGSLLFATVAMELFVPRLVARFGHRQVFGAGLLLLGVPLLALVNTAQPGAIVLVSAVRGLGFGIVVVLGSALVALLVPDGRRGEGLGLYGVAIGVPGVVGMPAGVVVAEQFGFAPVLVAGAVVAIAGVLAVPGLPGREPVAVMAGRDTIAVGSPPGVPAKTGSGDGSGMLAGLRTPALLRPALIFATAAMAAGVIATFLPLAVPGAGTVAVALLVQSSIAMIFRWWAGWYGDRGDPARLVLPALAVAGTGVLALALVGSPVAVVIGAALFGAGFGVCQNAVLVSMFERVPRARYGATSALWNIAYDAGMGVGALGFGLLVTATGFPPAFAVLAAVILLTLPAAWYDRRSSQRS